MKCISYLWLLLPALCSRLTFTAHITSGDFRNWVSYMLKEIVVKSVELFMYNPTDKPERLVAQCTKLMGMVCVRACVCVCGLLLDKWYYFCYINFSY